MKILSHLILLAVFGASTAAAQNGPVATLTTDKVAYEYGEMIELRYTLANEGDEQFFIWVMPYCSASFTWDDLAHPGENGVCALAIVPYFFPPGSKRVWTWQLIPAEVSMPANEGLQTV